MGKRAASRLIAVRGLVTYMQGLSARDRSEVAQQRQGA